MAKDPYRYFRIEAQELLESLSEGLMALEREADPADLLKRLLRQAHTLKGAARVVKRNDIAELAHRIEDLLSPHRDEGTAVSRDTVDRALGHLDEIRGHVQSLGTAPERADEPEPTTGLEPDAPAEGVPPAPADPPAERGSAGRQPGVEPDPETLRTLRVGLEEMDGLRAGISEAVSAARAIGQDLEQAEQTMELARSLADELRPAPGAPGRSGAHARANELVRSLGRMQRTLSAHLDDTVRELRELAESTSELRLVPARTMANDLRRAVRDAARSLDREVELRTSGMDTRIDADVLAGLRTALMHLVRNAVAHGIEPQAERTAAGKSASGTVELAAERRGNRVAFICRDDGRGLDVGAVRRVVAERGAAPEHAAESMDVPELVQLLSRGGMTTTATVDEVSGRGVGLDVVRSTVERLKGEMDVRTAAGEGTAVELVVPVSLSAMPALAVDGGGAVSLIPTDHVERTMWLGADDLSDAADGHRVVVGDEAVPLLPAGDVLPATNGSRRSRARIAVVVEAQGRRAALGVERLLGVRNVVVHGLPSYASAEPIVSGAVLDEAGQPQLVLAPLPLIDRANGLPFQAAEPEVSPPRLPVLVVDDSLTTRMLEQSILESAGYEVDVAASGEEALEKATATEYGLFVVDVEMPGMNGFELIERTRDDPELGKVPAILVTSRADSADRRRGEEAGARAYIVKSEFDQRQLLATIQRLMRSP